MATEIRPARDEELDRVHFVVSYSFNSDRTAEGRERMRHVERLARPTVLIDGGEIVTSLRVFDLKMLVNGSAVPLGGVSSVACLPEHRRKGHVGTLLRHSLEGMREKGQWLSALYTPHPALYRRFGWMVAQAGIQYTWSPKLTPLYHDAAPAGRPVRLSEDDRERAATVYRCFTADRTGYLERTDEWWTQAVFRRLYDDKRTLNDVALWEDAAGAPAGYAVYRFDRGTGADGQAVEQVVIEECIATTADAYAGLLRYINSHDLAQEVSWRGPVDEPLVLAVRDSQSVQRRHQDGFMLRVVDVERAIAARPPAAGTPEGAFTVRIADPAAAWNDGAWRIECADGSLTAVRHSGEAAIETDAATFSAMYNGFLRCTDAVRSGLARVNGYDDALLADRLLASDCAPFNPSFF